MLISIGIEGELDLQNCEKKGEDQSVSQESENVPKIARETKTGGSPLKIKRRAESLNIQAKDLKNKNVFNSMNLKRIDEGVEQSRN